MRPEEQGSQPDSVHSEQGRGGDGGWGFISRALILQLGWVCRLSPQVCTSWILERRQSQAAEPAVPHLLRMRLLGRGPKLQIPQPPQDRLFLLPAASVPETCFSRIKMTHKGGRNVTLETFLWSPLHVGLPFFARQGRTIKEQGITLFHIPAAENLNVNCKFLFFLDKKKMFFSMEGPNDLVSVNSP